MSLRGGFRGVFGCVAVGGGDVRNRVGNGGGSVGCLVGAGVGVGVVVRNIGLTGTALHAVGAKRDLAASKPPLEVRRSIPETGGRPTVVRGSQATTGQLVS